MPRICGSEKDDCHEYATCTDTSSGTHECTCNEGYTGDGWTCKGLEILFFAIVLLVPFKPINILYIF